MINKIVSVFGKILELVFVVLNTSATIGAVIYVIMFIFAIIFGGE